jgi:hypothetical protein
MSSSASSSSQYATAAVAPSPSSSSLPNAFSAEWTVALETSNDASTAFYGYLLLIGTGMFFVCWTYAFIVSKWMPYTGNALLDAIKEDSYYTPLIPVVGIVTWMFVYINWMSLKFFRHK